MGRLLQLVADVLGIDVGEAPEEASHDDRPDRLLQPPLTQTGDGWG